MCHPGLNIINLVFSDLKERDLGLFKRLSKLYLNNSGWQNSSYGLPVMYLYIILRFFFCLFFSSSKNNLVSVF